MRWQSDFISYSHIHLTNTLLFCVCICKFISAFKIVMALEMESEILQRVTFNLVVP